MRSVLKLVLAAAAVAIAASAVIGGGGGLGGVGIQSVGAQEDPLAPAIYAGPAGRKVLPGPWVLRGDRADQGADKGYQSGAFEGRLVSVPHAANGRVITGVEGLKSFRGTLAWYRTEVTVPEDGDYVLRFESVHHKAIVWMDGERLGEHTGVYLPFEYRVHLDAGRSHTLVVRADYRGPTDQKRSGWHRTWFNFGGLNREVTIRPATPSEIVGPTVNTRFGSSAAIVDITAHVRNELPETREVKPRGTLSRENKRYDVRFPPVTLGPNQTRVVEAQVTVPDAALWEPGSPNLYNLDLEVPDETAYHVRTGLRELTRDRSRLFLNGRRLKLHGASIHEDVRLRGDALTTEDMDRIVQSLKAIGANATRSQHQLNPALLERLDAAGIVVWQGIGPVDAPGAWTNTSPEQRVRARARARKSYFQTQPHPSIIAWNLANEVAGNGHDGGQAEYIDAMAQELHRRDPGRLVAVDVWGAHPPKRGQVGYLYRNLDAIAITNYVGWYEIPLAPRSQISRRIRTRTRQFLDTFPNKVVVISEFGAEANAMNSRSRPGGFDYQAWLLGEHIRAYRAFTRLSGMLVWNLRDFAVSPAFFGGSINNVVPGIRIVRGINQKGLYDYDGDPKPAVRTVRRAYGPMGTGLTEP